MVTNAPKFLLISHRLQIVSLTLLTHPVLVGRELLLLSRLHLNTYLVTAAGWGGGRAG